MFDRGEFVATSHLDDDEGDEAVLEALGGWPRPCRVVQAALGRGMRDERLDGLVAVDTWHVERHPETFDMSSLPAFRREELAKARDVVGSDVAHQVLGLRLWTKLPDHWHAVRIASVLADEDRVGLLLSASIGTVVDRAALHAATRARSTTVPDRLGVRTSWAAATHLDGATLHLHPRWLGRVWARGAAVIDGHLVIDLYRDGAGHWLARCLDRRRVVVRHVDRTERGWHPLR